MYIDAFLIGLILISVIFGIKKGLIFEFFSLFGILIATVISKGVVNKVYSLIQNVKGDKTIKFVISYVITFITVYIILYIILLITKKFFEKVLLGWVDRLGGGIIGLLKGIIIALIIIVILSVVSNFNKDVNKYLKKSYSGKIISEISPNLTKIFPENMNNKLRRFQTDKAIEDLLKNALDKNGKTIKKIKSKMKTEKKDTEIEIDKLLKKVLEEKENEDN
ncbi:MAG: hypothetical protein B6I28_02240 [Fusobacteriia bacterium 4572_132]|nr:MAG: hypothetical protein B6I28_02240 [Fusobacteriia bacterium 4572_132]